jgi:hypothetical protein
MNRRLFMKSVGMATLAATALLSSCTPKPRAKVIVDRSHCDCPACQAGLPTKELHWMRLGPEIVFLNNKTITMRVTHG